MKKKIYFFAIFMIATQCFCCTTMLVTKSATADGTLLVSHSDDDEVSDQRIIYVAAKDYPKGAKRPVFVSNDQLYPRIVGNYFSSAYDIEGFPRTKVLGYIDQVPHTYAYFEGNYAIMNEHQLAIGECTDGAKFIFEKGDPNKRLFEIEELSRIAMERCKKAREAIQLLGGLAEKYGYYGWGETLLFADKEEGWVFEICCTPEGNSALWVAKKVPDGEVFVAANEFRIREVDPNDPDMMFSKNLFPMARKNRWYQPENGEKLDWLKAVSFGEYNHPYYSLRRVWRAMSLINPSLKLSPWVKDGYTKEYPFSIKPEKKLTPQDLMKIHKDYYEGTEFDLSKGIAGGPFGCPYRFTGPYDPAQNSPGTKDQKVQGAWERSIAIFYCGYSYINQIRPDMPDPIGGVMWLGLNCPTTTCYVPFYVGVYGLPESYENASSEKFSRDAAWWAYNFVSNWATVKYSYMLKDIQAKQREIETKEFRQQPIIERKALALYKSNPVKARQYLTSFCTKNAENILRQWWTLSDDLIQKYTDGYVNSPKVAQEVGYPLWWRKQVGYFDGPISYKKYKNTKRQQETVKN